MWYLDVQHYLPDHGWRRSRHVVAEAEYERDGRTVRRVVSKDHYWPGDSTPNDLVLELESATAALEIVTMPWAADGHLSSLGAEFGAARCLAVAVRNAGGEPLGFDATLDVSDAGRNALAAHGILVAEGWSDAALRGTGQEAYGRAPATPGRRPGLLPDGVGARVHAQTGT